MAKYLVCLLTALILEIIPYSAVLVFGNLKENGEMERITHYYSSFSLVPFGNANFAPLITAVLTCVLIFITFIGIVTGKEKILDSARFVTAITAVISAFPLVVFLYSWVSLMISALLCIQWNILRHDFSTKTSL